MRYAVCLSMLLGSSISTLQAEPKFALFQIPGSTQIQPAKITNFGEVTGYWRDMYGYNHGFIRSPDGTLSTFDIPGSSSTVLAMENENGTIAGYFGSPGQRYQGFTRSKDGTITTFAAGKSGKATTEPVGINDAGWIAIDEPMGVLNGTAFLRDPSGQIKKLGAFMVPTGINATNFIVGNQSAAFYDTGWLRDPHGTITTLDFHTLAINDSNSIVGYVEEYPALAVYRRADGKKFMFKGPGTTGDTVALAINNHDVNRVGRAAAA